MGVEVMPIDVVKIDENEYVINGNGRHRFFGAIIICFIFFFFHCHEKEN